MADEHVNFLWYRSSKIVGARSSLSSHGPHKVTWRALFGPWFLSLTHGPHKKQIAKLGLQSCTFTRLSKLIFFWLKACSISHALEDISLYNTPVSINIIIYWHQDSRRHDCRATCYCRRQENVT